MANSKIESYVWKDRRLTEDRTEKAAEYKMVDMADYELQQAYNHCKHMLYNNDPNNPGRTLVLDMISEQLEYCGAELALRWFKSLTDDNGNLLYSNDSLLTDIRNWLSTAPERSGTVYRLHDFVKVHPDFNSVSIDALIKACRDSLGFIDLSKISFSFIYRLGIYFTADELKEMNSYTCGHGLQEKFDILKYQLGLKDEVVLKANPNGLTEQQFRDMIHLKKQKGFTKCKYSELTTGQLETLRKKVLYSLEDEVLFQVNIWTTLMKQIKEVVEYKHYTIIE